MLWAVVVSCAGALLPGAASAELAILANGDYLKVDGHQLVGDERIRLDLRDGGSLVLGLERVERIVDDEIVPEPEVPDAGEPTRFELRFVEGAASPPSPYGELFLDAGRRHGLNPALLSAMARAESAFDPGALSHKGARGLLQLMPATAERFGVRSRDLYDPEHNVEAAARYLNFLIRRFEGDLRLVLAAYNAGEGNVGRYDGVPPFRETRDYIRRIERFLGIENES